MPDPRNEWDYWENRRHEAAHAQRSGGCFALVTFLLMAGFLGPPLVILAMDFWMQAACRKGLSAACDLPPIIEWRALRARQERG